MSNVNFNKNNINDILKQAKQVEATQARKDLKKTPISKHISQIEGTGVIDAINYAPKREWKHLFTAIPVSDQIDSGFINKLNDDKLKESLNELKDVQERKQITNNIRNATGSLALGLGVAGALLMPASYVAGLGYLASWGAGSLTSAIGLGTTSAVMQGFNRFAFNEEEQNRFNDFKTKLSNIASSRMTDMHKYYHATDKLSKVPMSEEIALKTLSNLYTEANNTLREKHNVSLVDVYLNHDEKNQLKGYQAVGDSIYAAKYFTKNMETLPENIDNADFYNTKGAIFTADATTATATTTADASAVANTVANLKSVIGFKLHVLENIGVSVDKSKLKNDKGEDVTTLEDINNAINTHYGAALDDALLIFQGKHSMAAPIINKVEKVLQNALEIFSQEVIKQAKARNLKNVPEITGKLVEKVLSAIMLQTSIPANDTKLTKILNAVANNTALKVSANLNNYASDTNKAEENKILYASASLDNLYDNDILRIKNSLNGLSSGNRSGLASLSEAFKKEAKKINECDKKQLRKITDFISKDSNQAVMPAWISRDNKIVQRRWKYVPHIIPGVTSKEFNFKDNTAHIKKAINALS